jgi:hypothetical protein
VAVNISNAQFQIDNTILYGALMSSTHNRARRYLLNERDTMDGLKVFLQLKATFKGETNILHQTSQYLKQFEKPYSPNVPGGMIGYIDQLLHILKQLDTVDPMCEHYVQYNDQQKMSLILRRCSDVEHYSRITYDYYM